MVTSCLHVLVWEEDGEELVIIINISAGDDCPGEWRKATQSNVSFCRVASDNIWTCSSAKFSTNGISYQRVCGRARGYQKGATWAFYGTYRNRKINEVYASGLSTTYSSNPRQHIWTFASDYGGTKFHVNCPCNNGRYPPASFVGNNYYCESGSVGYPSADTYYFNDALWDGAGCTEGTCCDDTT